MNDPWSINFTFHLNESDSLWTKKQKYAQTSKHTQKYSPQFSFIAVLQAMNAINCEYQTD